MDNTVIFTIILLVIINSYGFVYSYLITSKSILLNKRIQNKRMNLDILKNFSEINNSILINSMGAEVYLSTMKLVNCVLGNSSSGINSC